MRLMSLPRDCIQNGFFLEMIDPLEIHLLLKIYRLISTDKSKNILFQFSVKKNVIGRESLCPERSICIVSFKEK